MLHRITKIKKLTVTTHLNVILGGKQIMARALRGINVSLSSVSEREMLISHFTVLSIFIFLKNFLANFQFTCSTIQQ